jgi:dolichyl-phosphate-mannose--protein O-mannosyl transferase
MKVPGIAQVRARTFPFALPGEITLAQVLFVAILGLAIFTRFWRLGTPDQCYFDEVYFPTTGAEILHGNNDAWAFYGHENTHPPLSKEFMAMGQGIFGHETLTGSGNQCWPGEGQFSYRRTDSSWSYSPFGWRFFGALAGVGAVVFIYLLAKRLFESEVAGLAAAFLLSVDGLAFTQSRIATPDTYVLFFMLGAVYFLVSNRFLLSGVFFGAAVASKWIAAFTIVPIVLYLVWRFLERFAGTETSRRMRRVEIILLGGLSVLIFGGVISAASVSGVIMTVLDFGAGEVSLRHALSGDARLSLLTVLLGVAPIAAGLAAIAGSLTFIAATRELRQMERGRLYLQTAILFPVFFVMVPVYVYVLTYIPMLLNGHSLADAWELNRAAYNFHSTLKATHPYQAPWNTWPILARPVFFHLGSSGHEKIYNLGNPIIFWLGIPALAFTLWQGLRSLRAKVDPETGAIAVWGRIERGQAVFLFVVLSYLGLWLPWATQPRIMFLYHYLPALSFLVLALAYVVHWLWRQDTPLGRYVALGLLTAAGVTFIYFYPHLSAVNVPAWLDNSYYWFNGFGPRHLMDWS